jgi:protein gp37
MAENSHIEWTDATWNPITGCTIISAGCANCYAMQLAGTRLKDHPSRAGLTRQNATGHHIWTGETRLNEQWLSQPLQWKRPRRIFVCAHGDLFHESVPDVWIDKVFAVMALARHHTFQVLTKRPERMARYMSGSGSEHFERLAHAFAPGSFVMTQHEIEAHLLPGTTAEHRELYRARFPDMSLHNVWLGTSIEDKATADARIPHLLRTPAALRFISAEPMLGPLDLTRYFHSHLDMARRLHWVIVGGESGRNARPMHADWVRSLRDQCAEADVPFFFKQWGEWAPHIGAVDGWAIDDDPEQSRFDHRDWDPDYREWSDPYRPMWCDDRDRDTVSRIGKARAGRQLDGIEHNAMPDTAP